MNATVDLGTLGGAESTAYGINASGVIVGYSPTAPGFTSDRPFRWTPTEPMTLLPYDDGFGVGGGEPGSINASGQIIGNIANGQRGFVTDRQGGSALLEGLVTGLTQTTDINDAGQVAGSWLVFYLGEQHAMFWSIAIPREYVTPGYPAEIPGYASTPADFTSKFFKTLTFGVPLGGVSTTTRYVHIDLPPDTAAEGDEQFKILLSNPTGGVTLGTSAVAGRIIDNDPAAVGPRVSVGDAGVWEGDSGLGNAGRIRLALDAAAVVPMTIKVTIAGGTATPGIDYRTSTTRTIKFLAGSTSKIIDIRALPDIIVENDDTATITLSDPTGGLSIGRRIGTLTIKGDDR